MFKRLLPLQFFKLCFLVEIINSVFDYDTVNGHLSALFGNMKPCNQFHIRNIGWYLINAIIISKGRKLL
jgi:hypothetical protein